VPLSAGAQPPNGAGALGAGVNPIVVTPVGSGRGSAQSGDSHPVSSQSPSLDQGLAQTTIPGQPATQVIGLSPPTVPAAKPHQTSGYSGSSADDSASPDFFFNVTSSPSAVPRDSAQLLGTGLSTGTDQLASVNPPVAQLGIVQAVAPPSVVVSTRIIVPSATTTDSASSVAASGVRRQQAGQGPAELDTLGPPATLAGAWIERARVEANDSLQNAASWLAESLPLDLIALDEALRRCLCRLDSTESMLADLVENDGVWPWLTVAAVASSATALAASWRKRNRTHSPALVVGDGLAYASYDEPGARL
jgi:hypothetical protein